MRGQLLENSFDTVLVTNKSNRCSCHTDNCIICLTGTWLEVSRRVPPHQVRQRIYVALLRQSRIRRCRGECRTLEVYPCQDRCLRPSSGTAKPPPNTRGRGRGASCAMGTGAGVSAVSRGRRGRRKTLPRFKGWAGWIWMLRIGNTWLT